MTTVSVSNLMLKAYNVRNSLLTTYNSLRSASKIKTAHKRWNSFTLQSHKTQAIQNELQKIHRLCSKDSSISLCKILISTQFKLNKMPVGHFCRMGMTFHGHSLFKVYMT